MSFLESFARNIGHLRAGVYGPSMENEYRQRLQYDQNLFNQQLARQQAAVDILAKLEQQRQQAEHVRENPVPEGHDTVEPQFGFPEQMRMYQAYNQAGLDPKAIADTQKARVATEALEQAIGGVKNPYALANIAHGLDASPYRQVGQSIYNRFSGGHNLTDEGVAKARLAQGKADEQAWRLKTLQEHMPDDPLMIVNALNSKELGKPTEAEVEGPDGKTHKAMITQTPTGAFRYSAVAGEDGKPLVIPAEAVGSDLTTDQKNVRYYSKLWGLPEAETAEILKSKSRYSDVGSWEALYQKNIPGAGGLRNDDVDILNNTFTDFIRTRYGQDIPINIEALIAASDMTDNEKKQLRDKVERYKQEIFEQRLAGKAPEAPQASPPPSQNLMDIIVQNRQQNGVTPPPMPKPPPMPAPMPTMAPPPAPIPEPLPVPEPPPMDFNRFAETVMTHNSPADINAALQKQGFNLNPETAGVMAIDAINQGVPAKEIQQLFGLLGIHWQPPS